MRIALLVNEEASAQYAKNVLESADHNCYLFESGQALLKNLQRETYDLILLDWTLPDMPGIDVLSWIRENIGWNLPVVFFTSKNQQECIIKALTDGADEYLSKKIQPAEMLARIGAVARRRYNTNLKQHVHRLGPFEINLRTRQLSREETAIALTQKEFDLAAFFFRNAERIVSRSHILEAVWGHRADLSTRTVDIHVSRLRKKLKLADDSGLALTAIYQHGYRLSVLEPPGSDSTDFRDVSYS